MKPAVRCSIVAGLIAVAGCGSSPSLPADAAPDAPGDVTYQFTVLRQEPYVFEGRTFPGQLVRIDHSDGARTYVHFLMSDKSGPRPTVVLTQPYAGIDWTGEEVDTRWAGYFANRPNPQPGDRQIIHQDADGPNSTATTQILYEAKPIADVQSEAMPHLLNDFSVVMLYGRFYAGGSVRDDIEDMRAGMWFVAEQASVDRDRVGVLGGSWGGFEALYASAYGDVRVRPRVTVALYPPADFATMQAHFRSRPGTAGEYLIPYVNRIFASTGGPAATAGVDYRGLSIRELCPSNAIGLPEKTIVLHDQNDNLVPIEQSQSIVTRCGADAVYWPRAEPIDPALFSHGKLLEDFGSTAPPIASAFTYAYSYLHLALARPDQTQVFYFYNPTAMQSHLSLIRQAQQAGKDVSFEAPRLRELCDPRLLLIQDGSNVVSGAQMVATAVNAVWGTSFSPANVSAGLANGLPTL